MDGYWLLLLLPLSFYSDLPTKKGKAAPLQEREGQDMGQGRRGWELMLELSAWPERPLREARRPNCL
ncbi:NAD-dependent epimerase/dehydratase isoform X1 [Iris pallida]|uniref:NAD-dependent epimerase/dehydratase isoform X1 n=1 Tax=Iris pallida TaxID=29817 RepID=A0AAX6GR98_IRIPA|nr:NAD-dependent epimerase/dehydratase isoform X1 [Iris pallida]